MDDTLQAINYIIKTYAIKAREELEIVYLGESNIVFGLYIECGCYQYIRYDMSTKRCEPLFSDREIG